MRRLGKERASMTLFVAAIVLPAMFFFFSLALDTSKFFTERERVQELIDSAAMRAVQSLPYRERAAQIAEQYVEASIGDLPVDALQVSVSSDVVQLYFKGLSEFSFASFFGIEFGLPYQLVSRARLSVSDVLLAMASSSIVAPRPGELWGTPGDWPASLVFNYVPDPDPTAIGGVDPKRFMTQRCTNPALYSLKLTTLRLYDFLVSQRLNSVGLVFFPGDFGASSTFRARTVTPGGFIPPAGGLQPEAVISPVGHNEFGSVVSDANCASMIDLEVFEKYTLPELNPLLESPSVYPGEPTTSQHAILSSPSWILNPEYSPFVTARDAIWSRSVREEKVEISHLLVALYSELQAAAHVPNREGLQNSARKAGIVVFDDLPWEASERFPDGATQSALEDGLNIFLASENDSLDKDIQLYFIFLKHQGNQSEFDARFSAIESFLSDWENVRIFSSDDPDVLSHEIVAALSPS